MKLLTPQYRAKSIKNSIASSRFILTDLNIKSNHRSISIEGSENTSFLLKRPKFSNIQFQQELTKANQVLDSFEINKDKSISPLIAHQNYLKYLETVAITIKARDSVTANCIIRGIVGLRRTVKNWPDQKIELTESLKTIPTKSVRENITQTYELTPKEDPDTINEDIMFIQNIVNKVGNLKSEKIIKRLFDLHQDLSKLYTEIPTPTDTPEPVDVRMSSMGEKLNITIKLIKNEIQANLNKHKFERKKVNQGVQTGSMGFEGMDPMKEKEAELVNLKRKLEHLEGQSLMVHESLAKHKAYSCDIENRYNEGKIELIQTKNKLNSAKDASSGLKIRVSQLADKLIRKSKKLQETRKSLNEQKSEIFSLNHSVKHLKTETYNMTVLNKITEEKLLQIDSAWAQRTGSRFVFENVSSIEVVRKYSLYNLEEGLDEEGKSPRSGRRNQGLLLSSPRMFGKSAAERMAKDEKALVVKPLVSKDLKITDDPEQPTLTIPQIPLMFENSSSKGLSFHTELNRPYPNPIPDNLPIIIESRTQVKKKPSNSIENFHLCDSKTKKPSKNSFSKGFDLEPHQDITNSSPRLENRAITKISTNLIRETNEFSSPSSTNSPTNKTRPIFTSLVYENEAIHQSVRIVQERMKNVEDNSKGVQCDLKNKNDKKEEKPVKRIGRAGTVKVKVKPIDLDAFDEETLENFRRMCEQYEINDFENMPQNLKMELLKSLEGHDWRRCENECVHLKRVANFKYKTRGIPYPIKTSTLNTKF